MAKKPAKRPLPSASKSKKPLPKRATATKPALNGKAAPALNGNAAAKGKPLVTKAKAAAAKPIARTASPAKAAAKLAAKAVGKAPEKPAMRGATGIEVNGDGVNGTLINGNGNRLAASRSISNKAAMLKPIAKPVAPVKPTAATKVSGKPASVAPASEPVPVKPSNGRPMLTQGPIAAKPLTKKGTFAIPKTPALPVKPVRRKVERLEPQFVVVQPPVAAVATSEKAAKNKAGLSQRDLDFFRDLLLQKRRELVGDMSHMEREALRENNANLSNLPVHMADQGTDAYEQEFTLGLVEKDRSLLREINDALAKIQNGTYGICEGTGNPIGRPRLEAQPWARHGIEYARTLEKRKMMFRR